MTEPAPRADQPPQAARIDAAIPELPDTTGLPAHIEIIEPLGVGGMGAVYRGKNKETGEDLAVKLMLPKHADDAKLIGRFLREANALTQLSHENIVQIYGCGTTVKGVPYIIMSFVSGMPLDVCVKLGGKFSADDAIWLIQQCAWGLGHAHAQGVIHRDLKPGNIMVDMPENDRPVLKLLDFGISKFFGNAPNDLRLTDTGQILGTPLYMSPENVVGDELDGRSDIYSLGCVVYESLTDTPPFAYSEAYKVLAQHVHEEPPDLAALRPDLPPALVQVVKRMMEKRPTDRYQSMDELLADVNALQDKGKLPPGLHLSGKQKHTLRSVIGTVIVGIVSFAIFYGGVMLLRHLGILGR